METKTSKAVTAFKAGDVKTALKIVKTFKLGLTKEQHSSLVRGYECLVHPHFYVEMGVNVDGAIEEAKSVFNAVFVKVV